MSKVKLNALALIPGTLFWVLILSGVLTENKALIGTGVVMFLVAAVTLIVIKVRKSSAESSERRRIWQDGRKATARIVSIGTGGGKFNDHPWVDFVLDVTPENESTYQVEARALISELAIPRIQPECEIAVRIDPNDRNRVIVDEALTPYGYK